MEQKSNRPVDWEAFVLRYEAKLYRTALAILGSPQEAEDAVQDTFLKYLEKTPVFFNPAQEAAWMTRVTVNRCISLLRSPWRKKVAPLPPELPAQEPEAQELEELYRLPPKDRAALHLYYYEGYSTEEMASILGLSPSSVRSRLARARDKLKLLLEGESTLANIPIILTDKLPLWRCTKSFWGWSPREDTVVGPFPWPPVPPAAWWP